MPSAASTAPSSAMVLSGTLPIGLPFVRDDAAASVTGAPGLEVAGTLWEWGRGQGPARGRVERGPGAAVRLVAECVCLGPSACPCFPHDPSLTDDRLTDRRDR